MNPNSTLKYQNIGLPEDILRMKHHGDFDNAIKLIDIRLQDTNLPECLPVTISNKLTRLSCCGTICVSNSRRFL